MSLTTQFPRTAFPAAPIRGDALAYIVNTLRQGYSCAVVGPSNTGKSLLLQSLLKEEIRQRCAQLGARPPTIVFVDCLATEPVEPAFYELLLRRIAEEMDAAGEAALTLEILHTAHDKVLNSTTDLAARSAFGSALRSLERKSDVHLVLILDEFDEAFQNLSHWAFRKYRVITNELEGRLLSVVGTSRRLEHMRSGQRTYEFRELFQQHTLVLRPMEKEDNLRFVEYLRERRGLTLDESQAQLAIQLSGGHPGLLGRIAGVLAQGPGDSDRSTEELTDHVKDNPAVFKECQRLWSELEPDDQDGLLILARGDELPPQAKQAFGLADKGLVVPQRRGKLVIFSPVFESFVHRELLRRRELGRTGLWFDSETRQVWLNENEITAELTRDQYALLALMCPYPGVVFSKDEIAEAVWPDMSLDGVTDDQVYQLISRLRRKLKADYIENIPRRGYRLRRPKSEEEGG